MKLVAVLQARCSSRRLPGKVMKPILGKPMLLRQIERLHRVRRLDGLIVATSADPSDDLLAAACMAEGIDCFRGSLDDVLDRFYRAALSCRATDVVRLTGDCPLADPAVIDHVIGRYREAGVDYASNALVPSYPDGLDAEVFRFAALEAAWKEAALPSEREHVTPFLYNHPERFRILPVIAEHDRSALRWTVDNPEDFALVSAIYEALYPLKPDFAMADIIRLMEQRPELAQINRHIGRNEGFVRSLDADAKDTS